MKPEYTDIEQVVRRHLPLASTDEARLAGLRVWHRLQATADDTSDLDARLDAAQPAASREWHAMGLAAAAVLAVAAAVATAIVWRPAEAPLYRVVEGTLQQGEVIRSNGGGGAVLALSDGSRVEMRAQSELALERIDDGLRIRLRQGGIIVNAAKQRDGHLYVQTKDMTVTVVGTLFVVNAEEIGSRVTVIEGEVRVREGALEKRLRRGEQASTAPALAARPITEEIGWSREAAAYLALLHQSLAQSTATRPSPSAPASASDTPRFEEAAIRPCSEEFRPPEGARAGGSGSLRITPGRLDALCVTLATLIRTAHGPLLNNSASNGLLDLPPRFDITQGLFREDGTRVRGGPDWVRSERYTVAAVAEGRSDPVTLRGPMLLALLERRFQLKAHVESEQIPVLALTVSTSGLRIKPAVPGDCVQGGWLPGGSERRRRMDALRRGATPDCGQRFLLDGPNVVHEGGGVSMRTFARMLTLGSVMAGGRLIVDRTNIPETTIFNVFLEYGRDEGAPGPGAALPPIEPSDIPRAPSISTALDALGLRLEEADAPREFIVIDRVERPSEN